MINLIEKAELHQTDFGNFTKFCLIMSYCHSIWANLELKEYAKRSVFIEFSVCYIPIWLVIMLLLECMFSVWISTTSFHEYAFSGKNAIFTSHIYHSVQQHICCVLYLLYFMPTELFPFKMILIFWKIRGSFLFCILYFQAFCIFLFVKFVIFCILWDWRFPQRGSALCTICVFYALHLWNFKICAWTI